MALTIINEQKHPETQTFSFWMGVETDFQKSEAQDEEPTRYVQGLSSDAGKDLQDEHIIQEGVDFDPLLNKGYINWDHRPGPGNLIGVPTEAALREVRDNFGLWMRGYLYQGKKIADEAWDHLRISEEAAKKGLPFRQLGWSVEGGIVARDERNTKIIRKSVVRHMALTHQAVNDRTFAEIAKGLGATWMGSEIDFDHNEHYSFSDFASFAKSMGVANTFTAAPLQLDNLAGGNVTDVLPEFLGKRCTGRCNKESTGRRKALRHLVTCKGFDEEEAFNLVKGLVAYLVD